MKKNRFNAIIFKDHESEGFVYMPFENGKQGDAYHINVGNDFMESEAIKGKFPKNKIILASVRTEDTEIAIVPKFCVELKFQGTPINFWNIVENSEYLGYFIQKISKKL